MDHTTENITLDGANAGVAKLTLAKALAVLNRYANMDTGEIFIALADANGFYAVDAVRPAGPCEVWVMSGRQPITIHGIESNNAYASACAMVLGLKVARAFGDSAPALASLGRPWLDELSVVMLRAKKDVTAPAGSIPLTEELYTRALQHGVDMTVFRIYDDCEEHF